ncbi:NGG1-interacting factor 3 [Spathaspora sp. JA1]|nr:NGG1-interacting factor 3 [Spathaspora sp. JA1]
MDSILSSLPLNHTLSSKSSYNDLSEDFQILKLEEKPKGYFHDYKKSRATSLVNIADLENSWFTRFNFKLKQKAKNIYVIDRICDLQELFEFYYKQRNRFNLNYSDKLFPYLHGLDNSTQCSYFLEQAQLKDIHHELSTLNLNNVMFIRSDSEKANIPQLLNTVDINDLLNGEEYVSLDYNNNRQSQQEQGELNCRSFDKQIKLMAALSHFVVYNYNNTDNSETIKILQQIIPRDRNIYSIEIDGWCSEIDPSYFDNESDEWKTYNNSITNEACGTDDKFVSNDDVFDCKFHKYEQNLNWRLNSRKWILDDRVCVGNILDFNSLKLEDQEFKLVIQCHHDARLPPLDLLESIWDDFTSDNSSSSVYYLDFPSTGSFNPARITNIELNLMLNVLKLIEKISRANKVFVFCYDGFTASSLLIICITMLLGKKTVEEAIIYLAQTSAKLYFFKIDMSFLSGFERFVDYLNKCLVVEFSNVIPPNVLDFSTINYYYQCNPIIKPQEYDWFKPNQDNNFPSKVSSNIYLGSLLQANSETVLNSLKISHLVSFGECPSWWTNLHQYISFDFEEISTSQHIIHPTFKFGNQCQVYDVKFARYSIPLHILPSSVKSLIYIHSFNDDGHDSILPLLIDSPTRIQDKLLLGSNKNSFQANEITLVHCKIGASRSASLLLASIMKQYRINLVQAYFALRVMRFNIIIQPNLKLFYELYLYQSYLGVDEQDNECKKWNWEFQKFYPISLADKTWDNTGLLVDSSHHEEAEASISTTPIKVLLTIDLTQAVTDEAIAKRANFIMAYHPFIFRGLKSITPVDPQQRSLIKLIQNRISVYSPHTAVDSQRGGVNDFLVTGITQGFNVESSIPIEQDAVETDCGMGRLVTLSERANLTALIENVKSNLGLQHVQVAKCCENHQVKTIAVCAGSGGGVFKGIKADLYYTGELSHHEALFFKENGSSVICCNHSNTERAFLRVIKEQLIEELGEDNADVIISENDKDPFQVFLRLIKAEGPTPSFNVKSTIVPCKGTDYVFLYGGFDESDALDSNVYLLNLKTMTWEIDNKVDGLYREGHSAMYIGNGNILIFGGLPYDDEIPTTDTRRRRTGSGTQQQSQTTGTSFRKDNLMMIYNIFDRKWIGPPDFALENAPSYRSRHACCLSADGSKLYISGGLVRSVPLDDLYCYDLISGIWSGPIQFASRFDHTMMIYNDRIFLFGGLDKDMNHVKTITYYSFKTKTIGEINILQRMDYFPFDEGGTGPVEEDEDEEELYGRFPGSTTTTSANGKVDCDRIYLDSGINPALSMLVCLPSWDNNDVGDVNISYLDLDDFEFQNLFNTPNLIAYFFLIGETHDVSEFLWRTSCINSQGKLYLLGNKRTEHESQSPVATLTTTTSNSNTTDSNNNNLTEDTMEESDDEVIGSGAEEEEDEYDENRLNKLRYILEINLCDFGIPSYESVLARKLSLGNGGLANSFHNLLIQQAYTDFEIIGLAHEDDRSKYQTGGGRTNISMTESKDTTSFKAIQVHKSILLARWPHFVRLISVGMNETIENKMFIPEPFLWIKGLIYYLYVGTIEFDAKFMGAEGEFNIVDYSGLLNLANLYELSELRTLVLNKLFKMFDRFQNYEFVDGDPVSIAILLKLWKDLSYSGESVFIVKVIELINKSWTNITRSSTFLSMSKEEIVKLCQDSTDVHYHKKPSSAHSNTSTSTTNGNYYKAMIPSPQHSSHELEQVVIPDTPTRNTNSPFVLDSPIRQSSISSLPQLPE